jgi:hypothetical protein
LDESFARKSASLKRWKTLCSSAWTFPSRRDSCSLFTRSWEQREGGGIVRDKGKGGFLIEVRGPGVLKIEEWVEIDKRRALTAAVVLGPLGNDNL